MLEAVLQSWARWAYSLDGMLPAKSVHIGPSGSALSGCRVEVKAVAAASTGPDVKLYFDHALSLMAPQSEVTYPSKSHCVTGWGFHG